MTGFVPIMWALWGVCVLLLIGLNLYRSSLTRDEEIKSFSTSPSRMKKMLKRPSFQESAKSSRSFGWLWGSLSQ